jgi:hypothetical protein
MIKRDFPSWTSYRVADKASNGGAAAVLQDYEAILPKLLANLRPLAFDDAKHMPGAELVRVLDRFTTPITAHKREGTRAASP